MVKHSVIGYVRGKGLLLGIELVKDRATKEPVDEGVVMAIAGYCVANGLIIGRTNRSFKDYNNTICLAPSLIISRNDIDVIVSTIDDALLAVCAK